MKSNFLQNSLLMYGALFVSAVFAATLALPSHAIAQVKVDPGLCAGSGASCKTGESCYYFDGGEFPGSYICQATKATAGGGTKTTTTSSAPLTTSTSTITRDATGAITAQTSQTSSALAGIGGGSGTCNLTNPTSWGDCVLNAVGTFILGFSNFLLGIAGVLLNWVIVKTVFQFSSLLGNTAGVLASWTILRDMGNLLLLFGFVLMGLGTILNTSKLPDKKAIPRLIIFAVLLNFSLFVTEAVIDVSNVLTSSIYTQANTDPCQDLFSQTCAVNHGIAGHLMKATGLAGVYGVDPAKAGGFTGKLWIVVTLSLLSLVGAMVFMAAAIMLAYRAIVLTALIILSPIGFAGMAIKPLESQARKWWNAVIHQSFFAPILILLIFITLKVSDSFAGVNGANTNLANALVNGQANGMGSIMIFVMVIGGLIGSLIAAKNFGAMGSTFAVDTASRFAFGGFNMGVGLGSAGLEYGLDRIPGAKNSKFIRAIKSNVTRPLRTGAIDPRRVYGVSGALARAGGKTATKPVDSLGKASQTAKKIFKENPEKNRRLNDADFAKVEAQRTKNNIQNIARSSDLNTPDQKAQKDEFVKQLAKQSVKNLEQMGEVRAGNQNIIDNLSTEQYEGLMKSENLSDAEKGAIKSARYRGLDSAVKLESATDRTTEIKNQLRRMSKDDLESLSPDLLAHPDVLANLTDKQRDDLTGSKKRTAAEKQLIRDSSPPRKFDLDFAAATDAAERAAIARQLPARLTIPQVAKLDNATLTNPLIMEELTPAMLSELQEQKKLKAAEIPAVGSYIKNSPTAKGKSHIGGPAGVYWT